MTAKLNNQNTDAGEPKGFSDMVYIGGGAIHISIEATPFPENA